MSDFENDNPFEPWNSYSKNDPSKAWNNPMYKDDPFAPWNLPMSNDREKERYAERHGIRKEDMR